MPSAIERRLAKIEQRFRDRLRGVHRYSDDELDALIAERQDPHFTFAPMQQVAAGEIPNKPSGIKRFRRRAAQDSFGRRNRRGQDREHVDATSKACGGGGDMGGG